MKATVGGYAKKPFFFLEHSGENRRWAAWIAGEAEQKRAFYSLVEVIGPRVDYLLKINVGVSDDTITWERTMGGVMKDDFLRLVGRFEKWFFADGNFQICVRRAETSDYFAYDDHGIFWM